MTTCGAAGLPDGALTDILPSLAAHLAPGLASDDVLGLPEAGRYVLLLVDGLGWANLYDSPGEAPVLRGMTAQHLAAGVPATTATSLAGLATGAPAAQHGMVGFSFRSRPGVIMHPLTWDDPQARPETTQAVATWFERLRPMVPCATLQPGIFAGSGLTRAVLRGADFVAVPEEKNWAARLSQAAEITAAYQLTYIYERGLDHIGHLKGCNSTAWQKQLAVIDTFIGGLREVLPPGTVLLVTGDHGMVDVPRTHRVVIENEPALNEGLELIGGEGRLRHLYTATPVAVARRWANWWGERAEVRLRDDALDWFGGTPASTDVARRIGDVVVALRDDWAALTTQLPGEAALVGMHGSLTQTERAVPLLRSVI